MSQISHLLVQQGQIYRPITELDSQGNAPATWLTHGKPIACRWTAKSLRQTRVSDDVIETDSTRTFYFEPDADVADGDYIAADSEFYELSSVGVGGVDTYRAALGRERPSVPGT